MNSNFNYLPFLEHIIQILSLLSLFIDAADDDEDEALSNCFESSLCFLFLNARVAGGEYKILRLLRLITCFC